MCPNHKKNFYYPACLFRYAIWPTMLVLLPTTLVLLFCQRIQGQNLVPNPSFEDVNTCAEFNQPCSPSAWFFLSRKLTTGYFPRFRSATGSRHLQIVAVSRETVNRQYWETMLLCPLQAGERYTVTLKIAGPENAGPDKKMELSTRCPSLRDIGLWFTTRFVFVQGDSILQPRSFLSFTGATTKDLKNGWFEIKKEFIPATSSSILVVGNFVRMANADILAQRGSVNPTIEILVDDLSVIPVKPAICVNERKIKDSLYAITWRHSDSPPDPDGVSALPETPEKSAASPAENPDRSADSTLRPGTGVTGDPLFGPEPRRDTPATSRPPKPSAQPSPPPPATDTIIIHNIQFDFDKYLMQNPDTLQRYRSLLTRPGVKKIKVVGFTDDTGAEAYNLDLSKKRAHEIVRLLSSKFAIPPAIIEAEGRGISRNYPTKELNRRVEIYIFHE